MTDTTTKQNNSKVMKGKVVSTSMKDTVVVAVDRYTKHPKYLKYILRTKCIKAHDAGNTCKLGDIVEIVATKPISKEKNFIVKK